MNYDLILLSHHKCATNWLRAICRQLAEREYIFLDVKGGKQPDHAMGSGPEAKSVYLNVNATKHAAAVMSSDKAKNIHFVRDPRDALVSNYYSWVYSHDLSNETIKQFREDAPNMSVEEGMLRLLNDFPMGKQLETWTDEMWDSVETVRYEDMLSDFEPSFVKMFGPAGLPIDEKLVAEIKEATSFRKMAGRPAGEEDKKKHFRKGQAGDWQEYFTDRLNDAFMEKYSWMGQKLGYWGA